MKERPIPFSAPMVRAVLNGTKTQTRRVVKPVGDDDCFVLQDYGDGWWPYRSDDGESSLKIGMEIPHSCPYGQPGDRLWVREAWRVPAEFDRVKPSDLHAPSNGLLGTPVVYETTRHESVQFGKLRPGMFMPRWASRITLEVISVRVERLQEISRDDAEAEGIERTGPGITYPFRDYLAGPDDWRRRFYPRAIDSYRSLWEQINGQGSWEANPWVWVVEFRRLT